MTGLAGGFKDALAAWASGVSVVTTRAGGLAYGLTVSSFTSVSLDPPLVLVCIGTRNRLPEMIRGAGRFAVSLLAADQADISAQLARAGRDPGPDLGVPSAATSSGVPIVAGAIAHLACDLHHELVVGDHTVIVGRVVEASTRDDREPLVYHRRGYRIVATPESPVPAPPLELWGFAV